MTWCTLIAPSRVPIWRGESRVQNLMECRRGAYGRKWKPWTLLVPGVALPNRAVVDRCWALLHPKGGSA
jgi:hypothetical protein